MTNWNRRDILKLAAAGASAQVLHPLTARAFGRPENEELAYGLFFDDADLERMRRVFHDDVHFTPLREKLLSFDREAERRFIREEVRYNDQLFHIARLGDSAPQMALLYLMTGDEDAADLAAELIRTIMKFDRWDFFLEGGKKVVGVQRASSSTLAVSLVSDWLGGRISADERIEWMTTMGLRGCEPCYTGLYGIRNPRDVAGWGFDETSTFFEHRPGNLTDMSRRPEITQTTNLRAVPAGALTVGTLAYRSQFGESDDVRRWMEMATFSLDVFNDVYKPDGSYNEGVSYGNYTSLHLVQSTVALERFAEPNVLAGISWEGYANYALNMAMPTAADPYEIVNFGDNGNPKTGERGAVTRTAVPYWIAARYDNGLAQWFANNRGGDPDIWALMWYNPEVAETAPEPGNRLWVSDLDWVVARTGFGADDLVTALRSGGPANHEHADRNGLIVKCFGEQFVADPYRPPYSFSDPAWPMRLTLGHSAVLIDGKGHEYHNGVEGTNSSNSYARLVDEGSGPGYAYWVSEVTQPYRLVDLDVSFVARTVIVFFDALSVVVVDRMAKRETPSLFEARFFGYNYDGKCRLRVDAQHFANERPRGTMTGDVLATVDTGVGIDSLPIPEDEAGKHPFVRVATREPGLDATFVTRLRLRQEGDARPDVEVSRSEDAFDLRLGNIWFRVGADGSLVHHP